MKKIIFALAIIISTLLITSCSKPVVIRDGNIKAHWIKKGEPAPFDGIELNEYTYYKLVKKARKCKDQ